MKWKKTKYFLLLPSWITWNFRNGYPMRYGNDLLLWMKALFYLLISKICELQLRAICRIVLCYASLPSTVPIHHLLKCLHQTSITKWPSRRYMKFWISDRWCFTADYIFGRFFNCLIKSKLPHLPQGPLELSGFFSVSTHLLNGLISAVPAMIWSPW